MRASFRLNAIQHQSSKQAGSLLVLQLASVLHCITVLVGSRVINLAVETSSQIQEKFLLPRLLMSNSEFIALLLMRTRVYDIIQQSQQSRVDLGLVPS